MMRGTSHSHPEIASAVHRKAYEIIGNADPFERLKEEGNAQAMTVCGDIRGHLVTFHDHVLAAIIGNTFDYSVKGHIVEEDFSRFFAREYEKGLAIDETEKIGKHCDRIVYLTDNCGEIVFDKLLIHYLKKKGCHITLAVKESLILNDATVADATALGLDKMVDAFTTTGGGKKAEIGINMELIPDDLRSAIDDCALVIAKGMANFESLFERDDNFPVAYLLAAKCQVVADIIDVPHGSKVAMMRP
jgi:uncharacterized protein with ATP-grasp and redox domains